MTSKQVTSCEMAPTDCEFSCHNLLVKPLFHGPPRPPMFVAQISKYAPSNNEYDLMYSLQPQTKTKEMLNYVNFTILFYSSRNFLSYSFEGCD